ncbi:MAG: hypothetical protein AVDCRST_MAG68-5526, partial [uncultured Gemmatimonadetes bacterium]
DPALRSFASRPVACLRRLRRQHGRPQGWRGREHPAIRPRGHRQGARHL